ncbi:UNKNOWN [Stylonychia lemnae]|uniref:Uncharacterized protein n=1 Tax=Stylonychia lemnae TaxID=5949 RepID=A0A078A110_STYLE|nr:UNKNOWN [Stylonychia lemnae]|eukprot:CDW75168.1 UNKNOWN [Stylonychia lemnae]
MLPQLFANNNQIDPMSQQLRVNSYNDSYKIREQLHQFTNKFNSFVPKKISYNINYTKSNFYKEFDLSCQQNNDEKANDDVLNNSRDQGTLLSRGVNVPMSSGGQNVSKQNDDYFENLNIDNSQNQFRAQRRNQTQHYQIRPKVKSINNRQNLLKSPVEVRSKQNLPLNSEQNENYTTDLAVDELAQEMGINTSHLSFMKKDPSTRYEIELQLEHETPQANYKDLLRQVSSKARQAIESNSFSQRQNQPKFIKGGSSNCNQDKLIDLLSEKEQQFQKRIGDTFGILKRNSKLLKSFDQKTNPNEIKQPKSKNETKSSQAKINILINSSQDNTNNQYSQRSDIFSHDQDILNQSSLSRQLVIQSTKNASNRIGINTSHNDYISQELQSQNFTEKRKLNFEKFIKQQIYLFNINRHSKPIVPLEQTREKTNRRLQNLLRAKEQSEYQKSINNNSRFMDSPNTSVFKNSAFNKTFDLTSNSQNPMLAKISTSGEAIYGGLMHQTIDFIKVDTQEDQRQHTEQQTSPSPLHIHDSQHQAHYSQLMDTPKGIFKPNFDKQVQRRRLMTAEVGFRSQNQKRGLNQTTILQGISQLIKTQMNARLSPLRELNRQKKQRQNRMTQQIKQMQENRNSGEEIEGQSELEQQKQMLFDKRQMVRLNQQSSSQSQQLNKNNSMHSRQIKSEKFIVRRNEHQQSESQSHQGKQLMGDLFKMKNFYAKRVPMINPMVSRYRNSKLRQSMDPSFQNTAAPSQLRVNQINSEQDIRDLVQSVDMKSFNPFLQVFLDGNKKMLRKNTQNYKSGVPASGSSLSNEKRQSGLSKTNGLYDKQDNYMKSYFNQSSNLNHERNNHYELAMQNKNPKSNSHLAHNDIMINDRDTIRVRKINEIQAFHKPRRHYSPSPQRESPFRNNIYSRQEHANHLITEMTSSAQGTTFDNSTQMPRMVERFQNNNSSEALMMESMNNINRSPERASHLPATNKDIPQNFLYKKNSVSQNNQFAANSSQINNNNYQQRSANQNMSKSLEKSTFQKQRSEKVNTRDLYGVRGGSVNMKTIDERKKVFQQKYHGLIAFSLDRQLNDLKQRVSGLGTITKRAISSGGVGTGFILVGKRSINNRQNILKKKLEQARIENQQYEQQYSKQQEYLYQQVNKDLIDDLDLNGGRSPKRLGASFKTVKFNV